MLLPAMIKTGKFTSDEHIKKTTDIQRVFKRGSYARVTGAKLFVLKNNDDCNRIAFALPRHYGNAVQRNYSKRLSREAYRRVKMSIKTGYDIVLLSYSGYDSFTERMTQIHDLCKKTGLYK